MMCDFIIHPSNVQSSRAAGNPNSKTNVQLDSCAVGWNCAWRYVTVAISAWSVVGDTDKWMPEIGIDTGGAPDMSCACAALRLLVCAQHGDVHPRMHGMHSCK